MRSKAVLINGTIHATALCGSTLPDAVFDACVLAREHAMPVQFDFNGRKIIVESTDAWNLGEIIRKADAPKDEVSLTKP